MSKKSKGEIVENTEKLADVVCFVCAKYRLRYGMKQQCEKCKKAKDLTHTADAVKYTVSGAVLKKEPKNER